MEAAALVLLPCVDAGLCALHRDASRRAEVAGLRRVASWTRLVVGVRVVITLLWVFVLAKVVVVLLLGICVLLVYGGSLVLTALVNGSG